MKSDLLDLEVFLSCDGSQLELRALAELSGDKLLTRQFQDAAKDRTNHLLDVHCQVGHNMTGWELERIYKDKKTRRVCKNVHFGIAFGLGEGNVYPYVVAKMRAVDGPNCDLTGITPKRMKELHRAYFQKYRGVARWIAEQRALAETRGFVETLFGFRRDIRENDERGTYWGNQAINCVDYETEILTERGWLRGDQLTEADRCLTETGWQSPKELLLRPEYSGPVHEWNSRSFSAVSTADHRWKVLDRRTGKDRIVTTCDISRHGEDSICRTIPEIDVPVTFDDDFVTLCGWLLTDGFFMAQTGVGVSQSKPETKREIQELMDRLGVGTGHETKGCRYWYIGGKFGQMLRAMFPQRMLTIDFISRLTRSQARLLVETMLKGDGAGDQRLICGSSKRADAREKADIFQALCAWAGYATTVQEKQPKVSRLKTGQVIRARKVYYIVKVLQRGHAQVLGKIETVREGNGVWCPHFADDAAWVARRRGMTFVTKNSPVQGTAHQFLLIALALLQTKPVTYRHLQQCIMEVHDALYFRVKLRHLAEAYRQLMSLFESEAVRYAERQFGLKLKVPILAEATAGFCMGSMIEYTGGPVDEFLPAWRVKQAEVEAKSWEDLMPAFASV